MIAWFLRLVFRTAQGVHFDQLFLVGVDPLFRPDLSIALVFNMNPWLGEL
jgi:hypothetical protein